MALRQHRRAETADAQNAVSDRTAAASAPLPPGGWLRERTAAFPVG